MAIRKVISAEDKRLRQKSKKVKKFTPNLKKLAEDMLETMHNYEGVGLAGPQIGVMQRIFVAKIPSRQNEEEEPHPQSGQSYVLVNPEVMKTSSKLVEGQEGCLSIPNWVGLVERPDWVEVSAQDLDGRPFKLKVDGLLARIFQHEFDHLNGILYIDHITDPQKLWRAEADDEPSEVKATHVVV